MTDKEFVLSVNPKLDCWPGYSYGRFEVSKFGILLYDDDNNLIMPPIPLKHEKQMWKTFRKMFEYKMLKQLET